MRTIDLQTVLSWNPCEDFPPERLQNLFARKPAYTLDDVWALDIRQDEKLWVALREVFFSPAALEYMAALFALHAIDLVHKEDKRVDHAIHTAALAAAGVFDLLPVDPRQDRWKEGATDSERMAGLAALWAAKAHAYTEEKKADQLARWNEERDWQIGIVKARPQDANS